MKLISMCAAALLLGVLVAFINSRLSRSALGKTSVTAIMAVNFARLLLDALCLGVVYGACRLLEVKFIAPLIAAALGLSVCGLLFLKLMTDKNNKTDGVDTENGGDMLG